MTLGDIIKEYRTSHGLSQDIIAERSGLSKAYISILERNRNPKTGEPPIATPKTINAIALAINSDFDTIFSKLDSNLKISIGEQLPQASIPRPLPPNITALPTMKEWPVLGATACGKPLHRELLEETVMAPAKNHGEDDNSPPAVTAPKAAIVTVSAVGIAAQRIASRKIVVHCIYSFISYYIGAVRSPDVSKERFLSRPEN